jgi:hypothetical protein
MRTTAGASRITSIASAAVATVASLAMTPRAAAAPRAKPIVWRACLDQPARWYAGAEAVRIADNVLLHQRHTGGWAKNVDLARVLTGAERSAVLMS